jgi:hypothetical protein
MYFLIFFTLVVFHPVITWANCSGDNVHLGDSEFVVSAGFISVYQADSPVKRYYFDRSIDGCKAYKSHLSSGLAKCIEPSKPVKLSLKNGDIVEIEYSIPDKEGRLGTYIIVAESKGTKRVDEYTAPREVYRCPMGLTLKRPRENNENSASPPANR